ncbi:uncharacterized protein [Musca autumnalis]|uniref:uncharacterized protein n=1 Tax=Musca autumnalis TaxID=221902 RepID=UPI003CFA5BDC
MRKSRKMFQSVNSRMEYAREHNQYAAFSPKDENNNNNVQGSIPQARAIIAQKDFLAEPPEERSATSELTGCICNRKSQIIECKKCRMLCYGRVSEQCPRHPNVSYLLDLYYCPSCYCSRIHLTARK